MTAQIIEFPFKKKIVFHQLPEYKYVELVHSWKQKFFNPYLNSIYSETVPYIERWYLEIRHCLNSEVQSNLVQQLVNDKEFCSEFIKACSADIELCRSLVTDPEYEASAVYWMKKLKRWHSSFLACHNL
jgi:hypothetical protein